MANQKIHEYLLEKFSIGDDDFFDIDFFNGSSYETAKVKGVVIKALASAINIYNSDGQLDSDRTVDGDNFGLDFQNLNFLSAEVLGVTPQTDLIQIAGNPTNIIPGARLFSILDVIANKRRFAILKTGEVQINEAYKLPLIDGSNGQVLTTDGVGNVTFQTSASATNIYNSDGQLTGNRTVDGNQFILGFTDLQAIVFQIVPPIVPPYFEAGMSVQVDTQFLATGQGRAFEVVRTQDGQILFASVEDGRVNVNDTYFLPATNGTDGQALLTNGLSQPTLIWTNVVTDQFVNFAQTQWAKTLGAPVTLNNGTIANGFTFFDNVADKVTNGTTIYNEYNISFTRIVTLTGTNGTANINIGGTDYLVTFNTSLSQTALDFVNTHATNILNSTGERVVNIGNTIKFGFETLAQLNAITILNVTGNLSGTFNTAIGDHIRIPYIGEPYAGQRLTHNFRVNFGISTGSSQTVALSLRTWADDSIIGSEIPLFRNQDVSGQQQNFINYTAGALDSFVTGGFYFALRNDSGVNIDIESGIGILIITEYQKPTKF